MSELKIVLLTGICVFFIGLGVFVATTGDNKSAPRSETDTIATTSTEITSTTSSTHSVISTPPENNHRKQSASETQDARTYDVLQARVNTEGWKTCRNTWDGWEIKYPPEWYAYSHRAGIRTSDCSSGEITFANWTPEESKSMSGLHSERPYFFLSAKIGNTSRRTNPVNIQNYISADVEPEKKANLMGLYNIDGVDVGIIHNNGGAGFVQSVGTMEVDAISFSINRDLLETIFSTFHFIDSNKTKENLVKESQKPVAYEDTSSWATCRNEWYGWEFQYPKEWFVFENSDGLRSGTCSGSVVSMGDWEPGSLESTYLNNQHSTLGITSGDLVLKYMDSYTNVKELTGHLVQGRHKLTQGYFTVGEHTVAWLSTQGSEELYMWHEGNPLKITAHKIDNKIVETILTTFRFFEPHTYSPNPFSSSILPKHFNSSIQTANWKTCTNNDYGYQFKVPSEWYLFADSPYEVVPECGGPVTQVSTINIAHKHNTSVPTVITIRTEENPTGSLEVYWADVPQGPDEPVYERYYLGGINALLSTNYISRYLKDTREEQNIIVYKDGYKYTLEISMKESKDNKEILNTVLASFIFLD